MNKQDLVMLVRYNFWANGRLLTTCAALTPNQLTQPLTPDPGWGTLHAILVHMLDAEFGWRTLLQGGEDAILKTADFPTIATLQTRWQQEKAAWLTYIATLPPNQLTQPAANSQMTRSQTILHLILHSQQHRAEAAHILTGLGHSPGELDLDIFLRNGN